MKTRRFFIFGMTLFLAACAYPRVTMVHPVTGDVQTRKPTRQGRSRSAARGGKLYWKSMMEKCVQQFEALGYKKAEDITPEEWERLRPEGNRRL